MWTTGLAEDLGLAAFIGSLLPLLIAAIVQTPWKPGAKAVVAFLICLGAAILGSFLTDEIRFDDPDWDWVAWFGVIFSSARVTYAGLWRPTTIAPAIEAKTNVTSGSPPA